MRLPVTRHRAPQLVVDAALIAAAWYLAFKLRFDQLEVPVFYEDYLSATTIGIVVALKLSAFVAFGDGGLVAVTDDELGERIRLLRFHGSKAKKDFEHVGYNSRLDEVQAAVLRVFLTQLDGWTRLRREAAARYHEFGLGEVCELPADEPGHVYHLFVCRSPDRDRIRAALSAAGIGNAQYYLPPLHLQPALRYLGYREGELPETERAAAENFSVPLWAGITADVQERVVDAVRQAVSVEVTRA